MAEERAADTTQRSAEAPGGDLTAGKGRRDEVGRTGIYPATGPLPPGEIEVLTPQQINEGSPGGAAGVESSEDLLGAERLPRRGNEEDKPDSDRLGD